MTVRDARPDSSGKACGDGLVDTDVPTDAPTGNGDAPADGLGENMAHLILDPRSVLARGAAIAVGLVLPGPIYRQIDLRFWLGAGALGLLTWALLFGLA